MTRQRMFRDWMAFYARMEKAEALTFIDARLRMLKKGMMVLQHKKSQYKLRLLMGMAYGVHQQCRSILSRV